MQAADASTPAPTYGTSRHSSSPCTVPSSPNGPCRTGKTTSAPSRPPPGVSATGSPSHATRRRAPTRPRRTSCPPRSSPARTDAADASETSCSEERPPPSTATRRGVIRPPRPASSAWSAVRRRLRQPADEDPHRRALLHLRAGRRVLVEHDPVLVRVGHVAERGARLEAGGGERVARLLRALPEQVGHDDRRDRSARRRSRPSSRAPPSRPRPGSWLSTVPGSAVSEPCSVEVNWKPWLPSVCCASCLREADDVGHRHLLRSGGDDQRHVRAAVDRRAGRRRGADHASLRTRVSSAWRTTRSTTSPAFVSVAVAFCSPSPSTERDRHLPGPLETVSVTVEPSFA